MQQARRITDSRLKPLPKATGSLFLCFCACATYTVVKKQMLLNKRTNNYKTRQTKLTNLTLPSCLTRQIICLNKKVEQNKIIYFTIDFHLSAYFIAKKHILLRPRLL